MPSLPSPVCPALPPSAYRFGGFSLLPADKQLLYDGKPVPLAPKAFDTLLLLVENQGHLLEKDAFLKRIWPDSFVEEVSLAHAISQVRKALRTGTPESEFIETVPKRGYRFIAAVEAVAPPADPRPSRTRLAVLPFENLSADAQREYVADGLTEEVIAALGQVDPEHFGVIGRTSMMAYKRTTKSLAEVGAELNAEFLVESSIRFEGDRLRITSRLIRTSDQMQIWSASFDSEPPSVLEFQRELSTAIAHQVRLHLAPERLSALERRQPRQAEAYDLYLRGRFFSNQLSPLTTRRALEFYGQAIALDPNYALAWAGLAMAYAGSPINGDAPPLQMWPRAREAAGARSRCRTRSCRDPDLSGSREILAGLGLGGCGSRLPLAPSRSIPVRVWRTGCLESSFRLWGDTKTRSSRCVAPANWTRLIPFTTRSPRRSPSRLATTRQPVECARQATLLNPEFWVAYYQLAQADERLGQYDAALDALTDGESVQRRQQQGDLASRLRARQARTHG